MSWIDKLKSKAGFGTKIPKATPNWIECKRCKEQLFQTDLEENQSICPKCDYHFRISAENRISQLLNTGSFVEHDANLMSGDPLKFKDVKRYKERLKIALRDNPGKDSVISGTGMIGEHHVELCVFQFKFMGGSMGSVVGEKITRAIERAIQEKHAMLIVNCSGGARMQEGIFSLMQMAKTSTALNRLAACGMPYISILTDPTTGGVSASFAFLGDIILAEPGATVGFAGKRVIEQTIKQKLPEGFQTAEFLLEHGLIDQVVHRHELRSTLNRLLSLLKDTPVEALRS